MVLFDLMCIVGPYYFILNPILTAFYCCLPIYHYSHGIAGLQIECNRPNTILPVASLVKTDMLHDISHVLIRAYGTLFQSVLIQLISSIV